MNQQYLILILSYLLGSIPFGLLISRARGVDIRSKGSGNIGATNVFRMVGKKWGLLCFFFDFLKGLVSAKVLPLLLLSPEFLDSHPNFPLIAGALAIVGHNFPLWLKFKGGKGIATSAGVIVAVAPLCIAVAAVVWVGSMLISRIVSLSSILAAIAVAVSAWVFYADNPLLAGILTALGVVAVIRHKTNIQRLLKGEEHRFGKKKAAPSSQEEAT
ncbi:glycerol-3-phosphate 1-O-acyltransferase PlsY [Kiritimatiellota bacterium B12222]|nr:glycerol-3-phosphate 1-O-acyltransferase PlsY [Kiritimatiellota bacterium B12222]